MLVNYHSHTYRCNHASGTEREYIENAIKAGFSELGFSDHTPYPFPGGYCSGFRMGLERVEGYFETLTELKEEYKNDIEIHIGFEAEYYPRFFPDLIKLLEKFPCEYLLLGQHFCGNEIDEGSFYSGEPTESEERLCRYVDQVTEGISTGKYLYIAHPDLLNFVGDDKIFDKHFRRMCENLLRTDTPLEINLLGYAGRRNYPNPKFWQIVGQVGNRVVTGFDAHSADAFFAKDVYEKALAEFVDNYHLNYVQKLEIKNHI